MHVLPLAQKESPGLPLLAHYVSRTMQDMVPGPKPFLQLFWQRSEKVAGVGRHILFEHYSE